MKRFVISILFVSVFCIGLGALVDKVGAKFKSDEKALALIRDARQAIGGDSAIAAVRGMTINGQTTRIFKIGGADRTEQSDTEIAMQLPDKMMKTDKSSKHDGDTSGDEAKVFEKRVDVTVVSNDKEGDKLIRVGKGEGVGAGSAEGGGQRIVIRTDDGTTEVRGVRAPGAAGEPGEIILKTLDGDNAVFTAGEPGNIKGGERHVFLRDGGEHGATRHNEMLRLSLGLLLTAPDGMDVSYTMGGESNVDGTACNIVIASFGGDAYKIYLSKSSSMPVMVSYNGIKEPQVFTLRTKSPQGGEDVKENMVFTSKVGGPPMEPVEINIKFSDYRSTGGVQLPYKWTQTVGGAADEVFDVAGYEINPANINDKFSNQHVMVRTIKKPDGK